MNRTKIEWCDYTWNPIAGCSPTSEGCQHCYAAGIARRFGIPWGRAWFYPLRLMQPKRIKTPSRIFVCSMSDIGHRTVWKEWRASMWRVMTECPWHTFMLLTKRPGEWLQGLPSNCWAGVTVESQKHAGRIDELMRWHSGVSFVSVEPMLEPVTLRSHVRPDWVIAGPETGPGARECKPEWIETLAAESPCFFDKRKVGWTRREWPKPKQEAQNDAT